MEIYFENLDRIQAAIAATGKAGAEVAARALRHEAQEAFARSQDQVPVDTGALKDSGRVRPELGGVFHAGNEVFVELTYGSTAATYAVPVHENLEAHHPHGNAKYLEIPMAQQATGLGGRIADKVEALQKGMIK